VTACTHPGQADRYELSTRGRSVLRVVKCTHCRRIVSRRRSRWKSRRDRLNQFREASSRSSQSRIHADRREREARRLRSMPMRDRLLAAMVECAREAKALAQDDDRVWKYHPVVRRYRRLVRQWWALPAADGRVTSSDRDTYKGLFAPLKESTLWCAGPHVNRGGHLARLHAALQVVKGLSAADWAKYSTYPDSPCTLLPELTRAAVHAIYRVLPELRKRDIPTQFNLWES